MEVLLIMTKLESRVDVAMEMLMDFEEFNRSGSKEAFKKQLREEFVRRSGASSLDEALATAMTSLLCLALGTSGRSRKRVARSPKPRKLVGSNPRWKQPGEPGAVVGRPAT
jgi:hypothetical protein